MTQKSVTAILVAYNSASVIAEALRALEAQPEVEEIIVVDNRSHDDTRELIRRDFPRVTLIESPVNEGFGRGNDLGLEHVRTPYALLVNPDAVLEKNAVAELLAASARYADAAILAPLLFDLKGDIHHSHKRDVFAREKHGGVYIRPEGDCCADFLSGALMLWNMALMKKIGFFDPKIFLFYEDDDICLRVRLAGLSLVLAPAARAMHIMGASSGPPKPESSFFREQHMTWSRLYLERKYHGAAAAKKLAMKLAVINAVKVALNTCAQRKTLVNRLRGRLAGVREFNAAVKSGRI